MILSLHLLELKLDQELFNNYDLKLKYFIRKFKKDLFINIHI